MAANPDFASAVAATATPKVAKTKVKIPIIEPSDDIKQKVDRLQLQKQILKQTQAEISHLATDIITLTVAEQDKSGFQDNFYNSFKVMGIKESVTVVFAEKYSINQEDTPEIKQILGPSYDKLFRQEVIVKLRDGVLTSPLLQEKLMKLIGDNFPMFFESQITIVPVEGYKSLVYRYVTPKKLEKLRVYVRQAKPSLR